MTKKSNLAAEIVNLHDTWTKMTKTEIANNIESQLYAKYPDCQNSFNEKMTALMDITGAGKQTVYSWFNHSREKVKMPFYRVCQIAAALGADIHEILAENK